MEAVVAAFNQEKALVGAFSVITNLRMKLFEALMISAPPPARLQLGDGHDVPAEISAALQSADILFVTHF